ncbi:NAD-dependent protein deacetylase [Mycena venus]|uniref:NAD-dependent protein deacetylase n=1 Tax=Mycena venus TaxID=2733690 RepID=A0A8H6YU26_9AGAR|nr:NAD-dependent protein deacetylase [Mycena venus]
MAQKKVLKSKDIPGLADYIASDKCTNIVLMVRYSARPSMRAIRLIFAFVPSWVQVGVSTSAGIPDFRSPETGLYANLARLKLPYPEAVFEINFFRKNPEPFYTLAHELYPGKFRPTLTHSVCAILLVEQREADHDLTQFIRLLAAHELLHTCFTQNIDTLERRAGVPGDKIIEAHGSFATQRCIDCKRTYDDAKMKTKILAKETPRCEACKGLVKPDIVFFGESLPDEFITAIPNVAKADLLIIMGTSMTVHPFAGLAERAPITCPRVLINLDQVGSIGRRPNDLVLLGKCDEVVRTLCKELGWEDELDKLWAKTEAKRAWEDIEAEAEAEAEAEGEAEKQETAEDLVGVITDAIGKKLNLEGEGSDEKTPTATPPSKEEAPVQKEGTVASAKGAAKEESDSAPGKL